VPSPGGFFNRLLASASKEQIAALARLYDRFAHALDPFSAERDEAERVFMQDVADCLAKLLRVADPRS